MLNLALYVNFQMETYSCIYGLLINYWWPKNLEFAPEDYSFFVNWFLWHRFTIQDKALLTKCATFGLQIVNDAERDKYMCIVIGN